MTTEENVCTGELVKVKRDSFNFDEWKANVEKGLAFFFRPPFATTPTFEEFVNGDHKKNILFHPELQDGEDIFVIRYRFETFE